MTHEQYRAARKKRGTQKQVAELLGLTRLTIIRRESGQLPIPKEAVLALLQALTLLWLLLQVLALRSPRLLTQITAAHPPALSRVSSVCHSRMTKAIC